MGGWDFFWGVELKSGGVEPPSKSAYDLDNCYMKINANRMLYNIFISHNLEATWCSHVTS